MKRFWGNENIEKRNSSLELFRFLALSMNILWHAFAYSIVINESHLTYWFIRDGYFSVEVIGFAILTGFFSFRKSLIRKINNKQTNSIFINNINRYINWLFYGLSLYLIFKVAGYEHGTLIADNWYIVYYFLIFGFLIELTRLLMIKWKNITPIYAWLFLGLICFMINQFAGYYHFGDFSFARMGLILVGISMGFLLSMTNKKQKIWIFIICLIITISFEISNALTFADHSNGFLVKLSKSHLMAIPESMMIFLFFQAFNFKWRWFNKFMHHFQYVLTTQWVSIFTTLIILEHANLNWPTTFIVGLLLIFACSFIFAVVLNFLLNYLWYKYVFKHVHYLLKKGFDILQKTITWTWWKITKKRINLHISTANIIIKPTFYKISTQKNIHGT